MVLGWPGYVESEGEMKWSMSIQAKADKKSAGGLSAGKEHSWLQKVVKSLPISNQCLSDGKEWAIIPGLGEKNN